MMTNVVSIQRRERGRQHGAMQSNRPVGQTFLIEEGKLVQDYCQIDGKERYSSGTEKVSERAPDGVISRGRRWSPAVAYETEGDVGDGGCSEPPKIFQTRRGRRERGGEPVVKSMTSGNSGRRRTSATRRVKMAGNHF